MHVVTVYMEYSIPSPGLPLMVISEVFRGEEDECHRICNAIAVAYDDRRPISKTRVGVGPLTDWQDFMDGKVPLKEMR
jgi:hypothetical protein